ncbi:MAG: hypothetical protein DME19_02870 [Verrucomicrobia bacterium]|nr:MAG: hypothetical protein DME19_02870 [Verrucomicrobiota bacterium]
MLSRLHAKPFFLCGNISVRLPALDAEIFEKLSRRAGASRLFAMLVFTILLQITLRSSRLGGFIFHRGGAKAAERICGRSVLG